MDRYTDLLFIELDRQIATQKSGGPRVNWTQFQMALDERSAAVHGIDAVGVMTRYAGDMAYLRRKMEEVFDLETLDSHVGTPPNGVYPSNKLT